MFAASLLMPEAFIRAYLKRCTPNLDSSSALSGMARVFGVGAAVLAYRLVELRLFVQYQHQMPAGE